jgi:hypothetical protein
MLSIVSVIKSLAANFAASVLLGSFSEDEYRFLPSEGISLPLCPRDN